MKVIKPIPFHTDQLISTTAVEPNPLWVSGGDYDIGDVVVYPITINGVDNVRRWESLVNNNPVQPGTDATKWEDIGPCNKCAMFDSQVSTSTEAESPFTFVIQPGVAFNSLALINMGNAVSIEVEITDGAGGPVIYTYEADLEGSIVADWYEYFFEPFIPKTELALTDIPPYVGGRVSVTLFSAGTITVGQFAIGTAYSLGSSEVGGTSAGIVDYSRKDTNVETGITTFEVRAFSKRIAARTFLPNGQINSVFKVLAGLRATPSVWLGADEDSDYEPLIVFGFYRDFTIDIAYSNFSYCSLEIEGLT
jgi:hypothetical protein